MSALTYTAVFCCAFALDYLWTRFQLAFNKGDRARAVAWGAALEVAKAAVLWAALGDRLALIPSVAGGCAGLWFAMAPKEKARKDFSPGPSD